jgi:hypothetical protein
MWVACLLQNATDRQTDTSGPITWCSLTLERVEHRKMHRRVTELEGGVDWIDLAEGVNRWRAFVNTVMNLMAEQN